MTQEEKELLLKDLCGRLPYGVNIQYDNGHIIETRELGLGSLHDFIFNDVTIKPYLCPMSSMTNDEKETYESFIIGIATDEIGAWELTDWLNKNKFDYRSLIPMGLALEAPEDMYKIWQQ